MVLLVLLNKIWKNWIWKNLKFLYLYSVNTIGAFVFRYNQLTVVTIGNSVEKIGKYAFYDNQLEEVTIPNSVITIDNNAFRNNN